MTILDVQPHHKYRFRIREILNRYSHDKQIELRDKIVKELGMTLHGFYFIANKTFAEPSRTRSEQLEIISRHLGVSLDELYADPPEGSTPGQNATYVR